MQLTPERDFTRYDRLIDMGVNHFSFCLELLDPGWFATVCPGKARTLGQGLFFDAMEYCASRLPRGAVSGEIIAGIEPTANTMPPSNASPRSGRFRPFVSLSDGVVTDGRLAAAVVRRHAPRDGCRV